ncbi:cytochrome P450 [Mesorhizobium sp. ESP7-2]|uniref:cytochrome P450 n=1 Tax=Mesorhizobium sp. ESP7-2 TaxID=2876622 RepID=UPI001CCADCCB|nr:cytochrome P450 [Mesorhizobium sp. ESP7-2]MBZ9708601.1 cytochrome P450 [Mesorhizobium sp. ESP7-2]
MAEAVKVVDDVTFEDLLANPYPVFKRVRDLGPVVKVEAANIMMVTRFDDIMAIERDPETFSSVNPQSLLNTVIGPNLMRKDGEDHARERAAIDPSLRPGVVKRCWAEPMQAICTDVISQIEHKGEAELFEDLAAPIAARALCDILGIEGVDWPTMVLWSQSLIDGSGNYSHNPDIARKAKEAAKGVESAVDRMLPHHRDNPNASVLSSMLQAGQTVEQIYANIKVAIGGGLNEPRDSILTLILGLLQNPDQLARVRAEPSLWGQAFEEAVRWISPIGMYPRRLTRDVEISGTLVREGEQVGLCVGAANHDDRRFSDPERFDVFREKKSHLAFGAGSHFCAGTWVSRALVSQIAMPMVFERLRNLRLKAPELVRVRGWVFRGPTHMPVVWDA